MFELTSLTSQEPLTRHVNSFEGPAKAMKGAVELFLQASRVFHWTELCIVDCVKYACCKVGS